MKIITANTADPKPKQQKDSTKPVTNSEEVITNQAGEESEDELFHEQAGNNPVGYEGENEKGKLTNADEANELDDMLHGDKEEDEEL